MSRGSRRPSAHSTEREADMLGVMVRALRRHGPPEVPYLDNGSTCRGALLRLCCEIEDDGSGEVKLSLEESDGTHLCSATLITNDWAVTAKHCVTNLVDGERSVFGTMGSRGVRATEVVTHPTLDVALVRFGGGFVMNGYSEGYFLDLDTTAPADLEGLTLRCRGYGRNTYLGDRGTLRQAYLRVGDSNSTEYRLDPNASGQIIWRGDSGGTCTRVDASGHRVITGVTSWGRYDDPTQQVLEGWQVASNAFRDWALPRVRPLNFAPEVSNWSGLEAGYFPDPDGALYAITGLGLQMRDSNIVTMEVRRRHVRIDGTFGAEEVLRFGREPDGVLERSVRLSGRYVATGFIVRADQDDITHLALRARELSSGGVLATTEATFPERCCSATEANESVPFPGILTGVGFRGNTSDVHWFGYASRTPFFTSWAGGGGGSERAVSCPVGTVGVGTVQSPSSDGRYVGRFGVLCASRARVEANATLVDGELTLIDDAVTAPYSASSLRTRYGDGVVEYRCPAGNGLAGAMTRAGTYVDAITHVTCTPLTGALRILSSAALSPTVGGDGGTFAHPVCRNGQAVDVLRLRRGVKVDALSFHCQPAR